MRVVYHKNFRKQYKKLRAIQRQIDERLVLFMKNPFNPNLNNHALSGKYRGYRSINITGVYRAFYEVIEADLIQFIIVDTHSNLYR
ncbi:MAG: type II toxin-antitoxin system mRNA interferase toxin, RelE/StbE family [Candidatus Doudnabacteria bacterium]|nr:type II toxin-antitoxin system mRNA interferase toxin, RelE/StbE family [Candidatus Doudnabacteria bacterium]